MEDQDITIDVEWKEWEDGNLAVAMYGNWILMASKSVFQICEAETLKKADGYMGEKKQPVRISEKSSTRSRKAAG